MHTALVLVSVRVCVIRLATYCTSLRVEGVIVPVIVPPVAVALACRRVGLYLKARRVLVVSLDARCRFPAVHLRQHGSQLLLDFYSVESDGQLS